MTNYPDLSDRAQQLLKVLIERYIIDGQPVGSRSLSREEGLRLSPATIRNVMSDIEEMGLITSPHTSSGRVPTVSGYRLFIDSLLTIKPLNDAAVNQLKRDLDGIEPENIVASASKMLSDITRMAGIVMVPRVDVAAFRHIEFLPLSDARVLVILVTNERQVHNKIIHPSREFTSAELQQAANYLNSIFEGKSLEDVRKAVIKDLQDTQERVNSEMVHVVEMAHLTFNDQHKKDDFVLRGETNLMEFSELSDVDCLRQLFDAFHQKRVILSILDECLKADGIQIFIGEESGCESLDNCSVVTSTYSVNDESVGVLGVIGPTRMQYERVIPIVDVTAKILGAALNQKS